MSGPNNRIDAAFARLRDEGRLGLFPFLTAGYPNRESCARLLEVIANSGADGIEVSVPFSDPLADGATIQKANARALDQGINVGDALDLVAGLRKTSDVPVMLMSYVNPLLAFGLERLVDEAAGAGVDGFIVPDLPLEEADAFQALCANRGLHLIYLVAPTSDDARLRAVGERASGFIYCVALLGTTGARRDLSDDLVPFLDRVRGVVQVPLVVGFGISTAAHIEALVGKADGAIVASALIDAIESAAPGEVDEVVARFVAERRAVTGGVGAGLR